MEISLDEQYWNNRYLHKQIQWDIGYASTPLVHYINQLTNKEISILIPGAGNSYEVDYLLSKGFTNITVVDISSIIIQKLQKQFPKEKVTCICEDFFNINGEYDLILEQTFFCALHPSLRKKYVQQMHLLLRANGKLVGVLFNKNFEVNPPFGGSYDEYVQLFSPFFNFKVLEQCSNSIPPRQGAELFLIAEKLK